MGAPLCRQSRSVEDCLESLRSPARYDSHSGVGSGPQLQGHLSGHGCIPHGQWEPWERLRWPAARWPRRQAARRARLCCGPSRRRNGVGVPWNAGCGGARADRALRSGHTLTRGCSRRHCLLNCHCGTICSGCGAAVRRLRWSARW